VERLTGAEGGVIVTGWNQRLFLRGTFFWDVVTRPVANVTLSTTPALITRQRQNLGRTRSRGVEINADFQPAQSLTISAGYEYTGANVVAYTPDPALAGLNPSLAGLAIPQVPRNQATFQVRYSKPLLLAGIQGRFVGAQFEDDQNTLRLRRFFTMDAMVSHPLRPGISVFAAAENIFDQRYDVGRTPTLTVGPPILARVGMRFEFRRR
jgi:outer membrane receptor protein involved in Fe transport